MTRVAVLAAALALLALFAFLTVRVLIEDGFTILVGLSLLIIAMLAIGVVGALGAPPDE